MAFGALSLASCFGVDVPEETTVLHGVIGLGMDLIGTLQGLIVILLIVPATTWLLNYVNFMIVLIRMLDSKGVAAVMPPITVVWEVAVVIVPIMIVPTIVVAIVVTTRWLFGV
jgi:hypothetical protein